MNFIQLSVQYVKTYNALIKYKVRAYEENVTDERRINLWLTEEIPDIEVFKQEVLQILISKAIPDNFIYLINRLYLLCETNSDLLSEHNPIIRQLYREYPITKELEQLSFGIYEFLRDDVFHAENEYCRSIRYPVLEIVREELPEFVFRNNKQILWSLYYFLPNIIKAYFSQEQEDFNNRILYYGQEDAGKAITDERNKRTDQIIELSKGFCDRNFIFAYLKGKLSVNPDYFIGVILSELLESLPLEQYAQYTEFDYSVYLEKQDWNFGKMSLNEYADLASLPEFERLIQLLSNVAFVLQLNNQENRSEENKPEENTTTIIIDAQIEDVTEQNIVLLPDTQTESEKSEPIVEHEQEDYSDEQIQPTGKAQKPEYLLPVAILNQIYEEFTNEL